MVPTCAAKNFVGYLELGQRAGVTCYDARLAYHSWSIASFVMRQTGIVKFFNQAKGYGFITPDRGDKDVFVHISALQGSGLTHLEGGIRVSFETEPDKRGKGPKAVGLKVEA